MKAEQGAEAHIFIEGTRVRKVRPKKTYRIEPIDTLLRKQRTKSEAKILEKLSLAGIAVPKIQKVDDYELIMDHIDGIKVRDALNSLNTDIITQIGKSIAQIHNLNVIHGDLTTSNMIWYNDTVYLIDFGLSQISPKIEDKAVDLHLLCQAIESYHAKLQPKLEEQILNTYSSYTQDAKEILARLKVVKSRGKNKNH